jgi:Uma2 family endonuclease
MSVILPPDKPQIRSRPRPAPLSQSPRMTLAEYIAFERNSVTKHHFYYGRLIEMSGAAYEHNLISANLIGLLFAALDDTNCRAVTSDQKIYVSPDVIYYPDVALLCGDPMITFEEALQNPTLIAEVLSPSTAAYDRGEKFRQYRAIASLRHYLLVEQDSPIIEHFERNGSGSWMLRGEYTSLKQSLELTVDGKTIALPLSRIYRDVTFPENAVGDEDDSATI